MKRRAWACVAVGVFCALVAGCAGIFDAGSELIPDPNLEQAVREAIGKPTGALLPSDLSELTELSAEGLGIKSIEGVQYCTNLTKLDFGGLVNRDPVSLSTNEIVDISPLAGLTKLEFLWLHGNGIVDIEPLVRNRGLMDRGYVTLQENNLDTEPGSITMMEINYLKTRGVEVTY